jgi:hypothetical protein
MSSPKLFNGVLSNINSNNLKNEKYDFQNTIDNYELTLHKNNIEISNKFMSKNDWNQIINEIENDMTIATLLLSGINIDSEGLEILGEIIQTYTQIKNLKLEWNYLFSIPEAFNNFCEKISKSSLVYLGLNNNKINSSLCSGIQKILRLNKNLKYLDLKWNEIGNDGASILINEIGNNKTLLEINLIGNRINGNMLRYINEFLIRNKNFKSYLYSPDEENLNESEMEKKVLADIDNTIPLKIIEQEKMVSNEFKSRYDVTVIENNRLRQENKELEKILEDLKKKNNNLKDNYDISIENEKKIRLNIEENSMNLKDELNKLKIDNNLLNNDYENLVNENEKVKNRLKERLDYLKDDLNNKKNDYDQKYELLNNEFVKINNNLSEQIRNLVLESEKNYRKNKRNDYDDLETKVNKLKFENQRLKKENSEFENIIEKNKQNVAKNRLELEEEYKLRESKFMNNERNKYNQQKNNFMNKIKILTALNKKLENIRKENNEMKPVKLKSGKSKFTNEDLLNKYQIENDTLKKNNHNLLNENSKLSIDLKAKENLSNQLSEKVNEILKTIDSNEKGNNNSLLKKDEEQKKQKTDFEREIDLLKLRLKELENELEIQKQKNYKIDEEKNHASEQIKSSINNYIKNY